MKMKNLISSTDLNKIEYEKIILLGVKFAKKGIASDILKGKVIATLFFASSTRNRNAFQSAILRAGGGWIGANSAEELSMGKGESLGDTIRQYSEFCDLIVLRHPDDNAAKIAAENSSVPVINCGSGSESYGFAPAVVLFMMMMYLGKLKNLQIGIYGTPGINRVIKECVPVFGLYKARLYIDALGICPLPKEVEELAGKNGIGSIEYSKLDEFISKVDILFSTRALQKGIKNFPKELESEIMKNYKPINIGHINRMKKGAFFHHISPRVFEVEQDVDSHPKSLWTKRLYFTECALATMIHFLKVNKKF